MNRYEQNLYLRTGVRKYVSIFFTWLQSFRPVKLQCISPSLSHMEEISEELPNFSVGIDLLGPDPPSNKNKAEKKVASCTFRKFVGRPAATNFGQKDIHWEQKESSIGH